MTGANLCARFVRKERAPCEKNIHCLQENFVGRSKWIEIDRKLDPNWTEEKSKALYQRKEEWLKGCAERLNEARANLSAAEELDIWSLLGTGEGITSRATSGSTKDDE